MFVVTVGCSAQSDDWFAFGSDTSSTSDGSSDDGPIDPPSDEPPGDDDHDDDHDDDDHDEAAATCASLRHVTTDSRVALDVEVACQHTMFGRLGVSVAARDDHAYVGGAGYYDSFVFDVARDPVRVLEGVPAFGRTRPAMTIDVDGNLLLGFADDSDSDAASVATWADGWSVDRFATTGPAVGHGIDAAADGTVSFYGNASADDWRIRRSSAGWAIETLPENFDAAAPRRALTPEGVDVAALGFSDDDMWWHDIVVGDARQRQLGRTTDRAPAAIVVLRADAMAQAPERPRVVVGSGHAEGIMIAWAGTPRDGRIVVPETAERADECLRAEDDWEHCASGVTTECEDRSGGLHPGAFALARTSDGRLWLAAVETKLDRTVVYQSSCDNVKGGCICEDQVIDHGSTQSLRLWEIDLATASAAAVFELPLGGLRVEGPGDIDMHASGDRVAISVAVTTTLFEGKAGAVRTIVFDD